MAAAPPGAACDAMEGRAALDSELVCDGFPSARHEEHEDVVDVANELATGAREAMLVWGSRVTAPTRRTARASPPMAPAKNPFPPIPRVI